MTIKLLEIGNCVDINTNSPYKYMYYKKCMETGNENMLLTSKDK